MLPPGLSFNAISTKALAAAETAKLPRSYWDWAADAGGQRDRLFPVHAGHQPALWPRRGDSTCCSRRGWTTSSPATTATPRRRGAPCATWGLEIQCAEPRHYSSSLTAVRVPEGHSADALRATILEHYNMSLGNGLGILKDRVFRIGHLGDSLRSASGRHPRRRGDGAAPRRHAARHRRRAGGDRLSVRQRLTCLHASANRESSMP